jgi:hypothetical protein
VNNNTFAGINLKDGEKIVNEARLSKWSLLVSWLSIPMVFLVYFLFFRLPVLIKNAIKNAIVDGIEDGLGLDGASDAISDASSGFFSEILENIPGFVYVLIAIPIVLLVLAWLGWCLYMTHRHFQCSLAVTDFRVIGKVKDDELNAPLSDVKNVYIEKSIWGRLFNYGALVIQTRTKTLTFKDIDNPIEIRNILMSNVENMI